MPETSNTLKVLILHHPNDDMPSAAGRQGEVSEFKKHLKTAMGRGKCEIKVDEDFVAGIDKQKEVAAFFKEAALVVFVFSVDFFGESFFVEQFEAINGKSRPHAVLYLRSCPYSGFVEPECPIFPSANAAIDVSANANSEFANAATAIAAMLKDVQTNPQPSISPETKRAQQEALKGALLELNYTQQPLQFKRCTILAPKPMPAAFLLHGLVSTSGANWLISKLLRNLPATNLKQWKVDAEGAHISIDFNANGFLRKLAPYLELDNAATYAEIANQMFLRLTAEQSTFVIEITGVKNLLLSTAYTAFQDFSDKFWNPLIKALENHEATSASRLIVFFVTDQDMENDNHFAAYDPKNPTWQPTKLQRVDAFDQALITQWLDNHDQVLLGLPGKQPQDLIQLHTRDQKIATILQNSQNGLPEMVFQHLCRECGVEFDDIISMITAHEA